MPVNPDRSAYTTWVISPSIAMPRLMGRVSVQETGAGGGLSPAPFALAIEVLGLDAAACAAFDQRLYNHIRPQKPRFVSHR